MNNPTVSETVFYAQPYDPSATGFYFKNGEDYRASVARCRNDYGAPVEEFEIQLGTSKNPLAWSAPT